MHTEVSREKHLIMEYQSFCFFLVFWGLCFAKNDTPAHNIFLIPYFQQVSQSQSSFVTIYKFGAYKMANTFQIPCYHTVHDPMLRALKKEKQAYSIIDSPLNMGRSSIFTLWFILHWSDCQRKSCSYDDFLFLQS